MYINKGYIQGSLARVPQKVAEGVVLLTVRVKDTRINPTTSKRDYHYPSFVIFGRESDKAIAHLEKDQEVSIEYKLETRKKEIDGVVKYFEDKVVTSIVYGRKSDRPALKVAAEVELPQAEGEAKEDELPREDN